MIPLLYEDFLRAALREDLGRAGDLTTDAIVPADATGSADAVGRAAGIVSGLEPFARTFTLVDERVESSCTPPTATASQPVRRSRGCGARCARSSPPNAPR